MKVLALIDVVPGANLDALRADLPHELRGSWSLFEQGIVRETYATSNPTRVVFVLEVADVAEARRHLEALPLVGKQLVKVEFVELRPFTNWSLLFAR